MMCDDGCAHCTFDDWPDCSCPHSSHPIDDVVIVLFFEKEAKKFLLFFVVSMMLIDAYL